MSMYTNKIHLFFLYISFYLSIFLFIPTSAAIYNPADHILLNCGSSSDDTDSIGRNWTGDVGSKLAPSSSQNTIVSEASTQDPSVTQIPYVTARISRSQFTYKFAVGAGRKFVRLYFYPTSYGNFSTSSAAFSVSTGTYTLLHNFNASVTSIVLDSPSLVREFSVNSNAGFLNLIFTPNLSVFDAYAFVNGIEIVSLPNMFHLGETLLVGMGQPQRHTIENEIALETVIRLNVGGNDISPIDDSGLFRSWSNDERYTRNGVPFSRGPDIAIEYKDVPAYIAPENVYSTARSMGSIDEVNRISNLTWTFTVDSGFYYLVRLHFCEIQANASSAGARVFFIYINEQTATDEMGVFARTKGNGIPLYKDYVALAATDVDGFQDLSIALHPNIARKPMYNDAFLNGLEIFKLSDSQQNLAGLNPIPPVTNPPVTTPPNPNQKKRTKNHILFIVGGALGLTVGILIIGFLVFVCFRRRRQGKDYGDKQHPSPSLDDMHSVISVSTKMNTTKSYKSSLPSNLCRHFSLVAMKSATNNFDSSLTLGKGGFGNVYKGKIDDGTVEVAIKRGNTLFGQGVREFQNEIEMLSKLRHLHLVSLIGYSAESNEMILVYDYMANGTLRDHLYHTNNPPLMWKKRLEICIGAARGLHYLHTGAENTIIHRDIKTTNILLDDKFMAKVSDFGLSRLGPALDHTHVSTVVKGSYGYMDPEYFQRHQLTEKSDVYSFGVVLFEVLCARPIVNSALPKEQVSLVTWGLNCQKKGVLDQIIDPFLRGQMALESFKRFAETAESCVADQGIERPSMGEVLWSLEFALQLQEAAEEMGSGVFVGTCPIVVAAAEEGASLGAGEQAIDSRSTGVTTARIT